MLTPAAAAPRHETPNAVMRTLAAPSLGTSDLSVWEVVMRAGQCGPRHHVDREQVWTLVSGELRVAVGDEAVVLRVGDTLRVPPDAPRQVAATADARAVVASPAAPNATAPDGTSRPLPWAA